MTLKVITYPNEVLRKVSTDIIVFDKILNYLVGEMIEVMHANRGIGFAAPQIGVNKRVIVIEPPGESVRVMVNPCITKTLGKSVAEEGCLSLPGFYTDVERSTSVEVNYRDVDGIERTESLTGMSARIAQHEIDHLDGVLIVDRVNDIRKLLERKVG